MEYAAKRDGHGHNDWRVPTCQDVPRRGCTGPSASWLKIHPRTERMALIVLTYSRVNTILASAVLRVRKASQEAIRSFGD